MPLDPRDRDDFNRDAMNFRECCKVMGNRVRETDRPLAGLLYVLAEEVYQGANEVLILSPATTVEIDAEPPSERPKKSGTNHRHAFGPDGKCTKCGKVKAAGGRPSAAAPDAPPVDARTLPLRTAGRSPDDFADGTMGSSGVTRR